jgi:hypothetical protein
MIISLIVNLFLGFFVWLFSFLPTATFPAGVQDVLDTISSTLLFLTLILPITTAIEVIELVLVIELAILIFKLANEVYNKLRGSGG